MISTLLQLLPLLGAAGVIVVAQLQVKEHSEQAALALTVSGGLEAATVLARKFIASEWLTLAAPLLQFGAVAGVAFGLITLMATLHPRKPTPLPAALANHQETKPNIPLKVALGIVGLLGLLNGSMQYGRPLLAISGGLALVGTLAGAVWVERQGPLGRWVLERRPDQVVWSYVHQLHVVNRRTRSSVTHWSAQLGLASGAVVPLPATTEEQAKTLVAGVLERCPGITLGFTPENATRFKSSPAAMRAGAGP